MPSIFNWKPKKLAAHIRVKSPTFKKLTGGQQRSDADDIKEPLLNDAHKHSKRPVSDEVPYIDRSSSPSSTTKTDIIEEKRQNAEEMRQYSPQRPIFNGRGMGEYEERDYFPRRDQHLPQKNVHFDDEFREEIDSGIGSSHQHNHNVALTSVQNSNSTPATPLTSNREPFSETSYTNQDHHHNYPPPPYSSTTAQNQTRYSAPSNPLTNLEPLSMLPAPQHHQKSAHQQPYRQPSPQSPLQNRNLSLRPLNDSSESYFNGSSFGDVVPPRPPRQQQSLFQRSNSTGSSTAGSTRAQQLLNQPAPQNTNHYPKENRANLILQQLRADDGAQSESDVSTNEPVYHSARASFGRVGATQGMMHSKGVVYLEFNKEVKRSNLPSRLCNFEQIKSLFLRSFPNLTLQFLNQEHVKIYVADRHSSGDNILFYELEDLNDVKDQTVLKIHQSQVYRSPPPPPPLRFTDHLPTDYISEPEIEERAKIYASYKAARPASALPERNRMHFTSTNSSTSIGPNKLQVAKQGPLSSHHFEAYYDPYYSDASSQGPRSGSVTPIIDKETKQRVETMERQLAGLSTLVRSALIKQTGNKDQSPDMMDLGRRLLEMQSDAVERFGLTSGTNSNASSIYATNFNGKQLVQVRRGVRDLQIYVNELRDFIEIDKQSRVDLLGEVFSKIVSQLEIFVKQQNQSREEDAELKRQKVEYEKSIKNLEDSIQVLENKIENRRVDVLSKNYKLRMAEVDGFQSELRTIDQKNGNLREQYLQLEDEACKVIDHYKNAIDAEADFLRREPVTMEQCGRRCQALNNMLATMKKLALVQDPSLYDRNKALLNENQGDMIGKLPPKVAPKPNGAMMNGSKNEQLPPLPHSPQRVMSPNPIRSVTATSTPASANANVLDSILDELNHTANSLPKLGDAQISNGKGVSPKQVVEASATLTLKEPNQINQFQKQVPTNAMAEKYDNMEDNSITQPQQIKNSIPKVKFTTPRVSSADPRRHFVTSETVKFRPTNSGHVVLSTSRP